MLSICIYVYIYVYLCRVMLLTAYRECLNSERNNEEQILDIHQIYFNLNGRELSRSSRCSKLIQWWGKIQKVKYWKTFQINERTYAPDRGCHTTSIIIVNTFCSFCIYRLNFFETTRSLLLIFQFLWFSRFFHFLLHPKTLFSGLNLF
jgi:hypothetical protein